MQRNNYQHKILDVIQATGGDIYVKNRYLYINGNLICKLDDVERNGITKTVSVGSVTPGVITYSVPAVPLNSTSYFIQVTVNNPNATGVQNNPLVFNIPVTTPATGSLTNDSLVNQFIAYINSVNQGYSTYFVASLVSHALVLTATTAYPVIIGTATAPITAVQTTQGVALAGQVANMLALGVTTASTPAQLSTGAPTNTQWLSGTAGTLAGTSYTSYTIYSALDIGETNTMRANQKNTQILWVNEQATNESTFITDLDNVLGGFIKGGTTLNVHELEVNANQSPNVQ